MVMYVFYDKSKIEHASLRAIHTLHVGKKPEFEDNELDRVVEVHADGHELGYIRDNFSGIPMSKARSVKWRGEYARFIIENLGKFGG